MQKWEYLFVRCEKANNIWKPLNINGAEIESWTKGVEIVAFTNQKGDEGWELITAMVDAIAQPGLGGMQSKESSYRLIFKRPKQ